MKAVTLLYHDAVENGDFDRSGFPGQAASIYKLDAVEMERHFATVANARTDKPESIYSFLGDDDRSRVPLFLTFDDGGISASTIIETILAKFGWIGHFFVTAGHIDKSTFVSSKQIRQLAEKGHVIGSHSWSHPARMSSCSWTELESEWKQSIAKLSDTIGEQVTVASVPGGYFSSEVAKAASACGIRALFTSEPVKKAYYVDECLVLGRFGLQRGMSPSVSGALASNHTSFRQIEQYLHWNTKKLAKSIGGRHYLAIRKRVLKRREEA